MADVYALAAKATADTRAAQEKRYQELLAITEQVSGLYGEKYRAAEETRLEGQKKKDVASGISNLIASGLANTTRASNLATTWEETVGTPARQTLESFLADKQAEALQMKAGIIERKEDVYPDYNQIFQAAQAQAGIPSGSMGVSSDGTQGLNYTQASRAPTQTSVPSSVSATGGYVAAPKAYVPATTAVTGTPAQTTTAPAASNLSWATPYTSYMSGGTSTLFPATSPAVVTKKKNATYEDLMKEYEGLSGFYG
jgi:hypothetical protein